MTLGPSSAAFMLQEVVNDHQGLLPRRFCSPAPPGGGRKCPSRALATDPPHSCVAFTGALLF